MIKREVLRNEMSDTENEFLCRSESELEEFLYEERSGWSNKKCGMKFDKVDLVVVEGPSGLKPWAGQYQHLVTLVRMCLVTRKHTLLSNGAFHILIFLAASHLNHSIHIINGPKGSATHHLKDYSQINKLLTYKHNDYFLDNKTGDLYCFDKGLKEWRA